MPIMLIFQVDELMSWFKASSIVPYSRSGAPDHRHVEANKMKPADAQLVVSTSYSIYHLPLP